MAKYPPFKFLVFPVLGDLSGRQLGLFLLMFQTKHDTAASFQDLSPVLVSGNQTGSLELISTRKRTGCTQRHEWVAGAKRHP